MNALSPPQTAPMSTSLCVKKPYSSPSQASIYSRFYLLTVVLPARNRLHQDHFVPDELCVSSRGVPTELTGGYKTVLRALERKQKIDVRMST